MEKQCYLDSKLCITRFRKLSKDKKLNYNIENFLRTIEKN